MEKHHIRLTAGDKTYLENLLAKGRLSARVYRRALGLLLLNEGKTLEAVATIVKVDRDTVGRWRQGYQGEGLSAILQDKARSGRPVVIKGVERAKITALACSQAPEGHARWSLRLLADKIVELGYCEHISHNQVGVILKKMNSSHT